jgi:hypothetical protein
MQFAHMLRHDDVICVRATETRVWTAHGDSGGRLRSLPLPEELRGRLNTVREKDK